MRRASKRRRGAAVAAAFGLTALAGCVDRLDRRETIGPYAGEALAANRLAQTVNPWGSGATDLPANGNRMRIAIERYNANKSITPHGLTTSAIVVTSGAEGASAPPAPAN
jgi:hypothetical protein